MDDDMEDTCDITFESTANETLNVTLESGIEWSMDASFSIVELVDQVRSAEAIASGRSSTPKKASQEPAFCLLFTLPRPSPGKLLQNMQSQLYQSFQVFA